MAHILQDSTECHIKKKRSIIYEVELDQHNNEEIKTEPQEEYDAQVDENNQCSHLEDRLVVIKSEPFNIETDIKIELQEEYDEQVNKNNQWSHLEDPLYVIKSEPDDFETDDKEIKLEIEDTILEEKNPNVTGSSSQLADNTCPKVVEIVLHGIHVKQSTAGASVTKKIKALKDTEDANKRKIELERKKETEDIIIKEPKKTRIIKPVTTSKILTSKKLDFKLNKCKNVVTFCKEKSTNNTSLEHNVNSVSISKNKQFICDTCKKCFIQKNNLKYHLRIHTGEKPFECNFCKKCFIQKCDLNKHIRKHTGERPYECSFCKKCFIQKSDLQKHIRVHTSEKPYKCNLCKKCYSQNSGLKNHMRKHTGERPHECNICKKCFAQKGVLKRHIRTHTSEKPYQCNVCQKGFIQKSNLNRHILTHTGEKPM